MALIAAVLCCSTAFAAQVTRINVSEVGNDINVSIEANAPVTYKVSLQDSPRALAVTVFNAVMNLPYDYFPVDKGQIDKIYARQDGNNVRVSLMLKNMPEYYDHAALGDGRVVRVSASRAARAAAQPGMSDIPDLDALLGGEFLSPDYFSPPHTPARDVRVPIGDTGVDDTPFIAGELVFVDAPIEDVTAALSRETGVQFLLDPDLVTGEEDIESSITLTLADMTVLQAVKLIAYSQGWAWTRAGDVFILAKEAHNLYEGFHEDLHYTTALVTETSKPVDVRLFYLKYMNPYDATTVLRSFLPTTGVPDLARNAVIIRGIASDLDDAERMLRQLDVPISQQITEIITLKHIQAWRLGNLIEPVLNHPYYGSAAFYWDPASAEDATTRLIYIIPDSLSNSLVYIGPRQYLDRLKALINHYDQPAQADIIRVIPLKYMSLADLGEDNFLQDFLDRSPTNRNYGDGGEAELFTFDEVNNALVFTGPEHEYERLKQLVDLLDVPESETVVVPVVLQHISVQDLKASGMMETMMGHYRFGWGSSEADGSATLFDYNIPMNAVLVNARRKHIREIEEFIRMIDSEFSNVETRRFVLNHISISRAMQALEGVLPEGEGEDRPGGGFFDYEPISGSDDAMTESAFTSLDVDASLNVDLVPGGESGHFVEARALRCYGVAAQSAILCHGPKPILDRVAKTLELIDIKHRQVRIDMHIMEVTASDIKEIQTALIFRDGAARISTQAQIDTGAGDRNPHSENVAGVLNHVGGYQMDSDGGGMFEIVDPQRFTRNFVSSLHALARQERANVVASPSLITGEHKIARVYFGDSYAVRTRDVSDTTGRVTYSVEGEPVGITLTILPHMTDDGYVVLNISANIETLRYLDPETGFPIKNKKTISIEARVRDKEPFVIAGLSSIIETESDSRVPILSDIPIIGNLFRSKNKSTREYEVVVIITPTVLDD